MMTEKGCGSSDGLLMIKRERMSIYGK